MEFGKKIRVNGKRLMTKVSGGPKYFTYVKELKLGNALMVSEDTYLSGGTDLYIKYTGPRSMSYTINSPVGTHTLPILGALSSNTLLNDITVDWGDGSDNLVLSEGQTITSSDIQHTYNEVGTYTITITAYKGIIPHFKFNNQRGWLTSLNTPLLSFDYTTPYYTSLQGALELCNSLTSLPSNLLKNNPQITNFKGFLQSSGIVSIPEGLLDYSKDNLINCLDLAKSCHNLITIPANLFYNVKPICLTSAFESCENLSSYIDADTFFGDLSHFDPTVSWAGANSVFNGCVLSTGDANVFVDKIINSSFSSHHASALRGCSLWDGWANIDSSWK